jgi:hypothetical protein
MDMGCTDPSAGSLPGNPHDLTDLAALWRERNRLLDEFEAIPNALEDCADKRRVWDRALAAKDAIIEARPSTPAGLAVQCRLLADSIRTGHRPEDADLADAIAEQLEALAAPTEPC